MREILQGRRFRWELVKLLGEGDAGEAWLARKEGEERLAFVVKRPSRLAFGGNVERQARQIRQEGQVLAALEAVEVEVGGATVRPVRLVDRAIRGRGSDEFIVIERARGVALNLLRALYEGRAEVPLERDMALRRFLRRFQKLERFPALLVYRSVGGLARLLEAVHSKQVEVEGEVYGGVIWNDVKVEHLFWDPVGRQLTVIDWGNAQLLTSEGVSVDRRYSRQDDYRQFCEEMGRYVRAVRVGVDLFAGNCAAFGAVELRRVARRAESLAERAREALERLRLREKEAIEIRQGEEPGDLYQEIVGYGEVPDYSLVRTYWRRQQAQALDMMDAGQYRRASSELGEEAASVIEALMALYEALMKAKPGAESLRKVKALTKKAHEALGLREGKAAAWAQIFWWLDDLAEEVGREGELGRYVRGAMEAVRGAAGLAPKRPLEAFLENLGDVGEEERERLRKAWQDPQRGVEIQLNYEEVEALGMGPVLRERVLQIPIRLGNSVADLWAHMPMWKRRDITVERVQRQLEEWLLYDPDRRRIKTLAAEVEKAFAWLESFEKGPEGYYKPGPQTLKKFAEEMLQSYRRNWPRAKWLDERVAFLEGLKRNRGKRLPSLAGQYPELAATAAWIGRALKVEKGVLDEFYRLLSAGRFAKAYRYAEENLVLYPAYQALAGAFGRCHGQIYGIDVGDAVAKDDEAGNDNDVVKGDKEFEKYRRCCKSMQTWWNGISKGGEREARKAFEDGVRRCKGVMQAWIQEMRKEVINAAKGYHDEVQNLWREWKDEKETCRKNLYIDQKCGEIGRKAHKLAGRGRSAPFKVYYQRVYGESVDDVVQKLSQVYREVVSVSEGAPHRHTALQRGVSRPSPGRSRLWGGVGSVFVVVAVLCVFGVFGVFGMVWWGTHARGIPSPPVTVGMPTVPPFDGGGGESGQRPEKQGGGVVPKGGGETALPAGTLSTSTPMPSATTVPTFTPTSPPTPTSTPTITPTPQWCRLGREVLSHGEKDYEHWKSQCGWKATFAQASLDNALWQWLQQPQGDVRQLIVHNFPEAEGKIPEDIPEKDLAYWVRATLAMCDAPWRMTAVQREIWNTYRKKHLNRFDGAGALAEVLCGSPLMPAQGDKPRRVVSLVDKFLEHDQKVAPDVYRVGRSVRWRLSGASPAPLMPEVVQARMPFWQETAVLRMGFCLSGPTSPSLQETKETNPPVVFWLQRGDAQFGLEMDWIGSSYTLDALRQREGARVVSSLPREKHKTLTCDAGWGPQAYLEIVTVGRMTLWSVRMRGEERELVGFPLVWPMFEGENARLNFWWAMELQPPVQPTLAVQVVIFPLEYEKSAP